MKQALHRLFCLLLCAVMVVGMIPATASAAQNDKISVAYEETTVTTEEEGYLVDISENGTRKYTPTTFKKEHTVLAPAENKSLSFEAKKAITTDEWSINFTTFEDLKELAADTYTEWTYVYYQGSEDLVISEDLTLPKYMDLYISNDQDLIIPAGVTLTVTSDIQVYDGDLTVEGALILNSYSSFRGDVTVTGSITAYSDIRLDFDSELTGLGNIQFANEWCSLRYCCDAEDVAEIRKAIAAANANPGYDYEINFNPDEDSVITSDLTFPENVAFDSWSSSSITINSGVTVTFNNYAWISNSLLVKGELVNNDRLHYYGRNYGNAIEFASTGSYSGNGYLYIYVNEDDADYTPYVIGLDTTDLDIVDYQDGDTRFWQIRNLSGLTRLSAPTNLGWNKALRYYWNEETESWYSKWETFYGYIRFKGGSVLEESQDYTRYRLILYKDGEQYYSTFFGYSNEYLKEGNYVSDYIASEKDFETGDYYFTVQAVSDSVDYLDSEIVQSSTWSYTKPTGRYARPTSAKWVNGPRAEWTPANEDYLFSKVELYYAPTADAEPERMYWVWGENMIAYELDEWDLTNYGPGYYYFKVRILSDNIKSKFHSAWTEMSAAFHYTGKNKPVAPTVTRSIDASSGKPVISWERSPGASKYRIYRSTSKSGTYSAIDVVESEYTEFYYSYKDTTAKPGTKYYYKVRAYSYTDVYSNLSSAVSALCDLARPTVSISNDASSGKPVVSWKTVSGADRYYIYRATSKSGTYTKVKTAVSARSFEDTTAKAGTSYYYKVKAIYDDNSDANSAYSKIVNRMCDLKRPVVNISLSTAGNPYLKWTAISGAEKYYIYRATSKSGTYKYLASTTSAKYVDKDVTEGKTYYYKVKAIHAKSGANSAYSAIDHITAK